MALWAYHLTAVATSLGTPFNPQNKILARCFCQKSTSVLLSVCTGKSKRTAGLMQTVQLLPETRCPPSQLEVWYTEQHHLSPPSASSAPPRHWRGRGLLCIASKGMTGIWKFTKTRMDESCSVSEVEGKAPNNPKLYTSLSTKIRSSVWGKLLEEIMRSLMPNMLIQLRSYVKKIYKIT